jgi:hypothetical protein
MLIFSLGYLRLEVLTAVKMTMVIFWAVTQCDFVGGYQSFGGTHCIHLQGETNIEAIRSSETMVIIYKTTQPLTSSQYTISS